MKLSAVLPCLLMIQNIFFHSFIQDLQTLLPKAEKLFSFLNISAVISDKREQPQGKEGLLMSKEKRPETWKQRQRRLTVEVRASEIPETI